MQSNWRTHQRDLIKAPSSASRKHPGTAAAAAAALSKRNLGRAFLTPSDGGVRPTDHAAHMLLVCV